MCGIFIALNTKDAINRDRFDKARDRLIHRGPDAGGSVFLQNDRVAIGHRRLSILDLSSAANQPMRFGSTWISFNGEIYNFAVLRDELEKKGCNFSTHSDTEVLLQGYKVWGETICNRLEGMFAFAIWDDDTRELFLVRDHVGQKPLYYAEIGHQFLIASEIKAIDSYLTRSLTLRPESILDFQLKGCVPEPLTWYREIRCLSAGHNMRVIFKNDGFKFKETEYWNYSPNPEPEPTTTADAMEKMVEKINYAVNSHMVSDVEVGAFLSGGVDSTCIVTTASKLIDRPIKTFSIGFGSKDGDELPIIQSTVRNLETIHNQEIVKNEDFCKSINSVLDIFDHPFADTSLVPTERVSALAAQDVKVVLTGDGGDEVFGGYDFGWFISPFLVSSKAKKFNRNLVKSELQLLRDKVYYTIYGASGWRAKGNYLHRMISRKNVINKVGAEMREALQNYDIYWAYDKYKNPKIDSFREALWIHLKTVLPSKLLAKVDRCSMRNSLETRAPFLLHHLIETMLDMSTEVRNPKEDWYKGLFRNWLKGKISNEVLHAPKRGFSTPRHWQPVNVNEENANLLNQCIHAGIINPSIVPGLNKKPLRLWKYMQIEQAYTENKFIMK